MGAMKQIAIEKLNKEEEEKLLWEKQQRKLSKIRTIKEIKEYCKEHGLVVRRANVKSHNVKVAFESTHVLATGVQKREFDIRETYDLRISRKGSPLKSISNRMDIPIVSLPGPFEGLHDWIYSDFVHYVKTLIAIGGCKNITRELYHIDDDGYDMKEFSHTYSWDDLEDLYKDEPGYDSCFEPEYANEFDNPDYLIDVLFGWADITYIPH